MESNMSALDEYDIRKAFDALDEAQDGFITLRDLQTLYLGLGYFDEEDEGNEPTLAMLRKEIDSVYQKGGPPTNYNELSIETVVQVLSKHTRNRSSYVNDGFRLLDKGNKGYISANDVQQLSQEVGKHPVSYAQAKRMVQHCSQDEGIVVDQKDFAQLLSPPEP